MANLTKEQRYRKDNPDATAYDMLQAGAIDEERFNELSAQAPKEAQAEPASNKLIPTRTVQHRAQPQTSSYNAPSSGNAYLNDRVLSKSTWMTREAAERMVRKNPKRYTVS